MKLRTLTDSNRSMDCAEIEELCFTKWRLPASLPHQQMSCREQGYIRLPAMDRSQARSQGFSGERGQSSAVKLQSCHDQVFPAFSK